MKISSVIDVVYEHTVNNMMHPKQDIFSFFKPDKSQNIATLVCHKSELPLRPNYEKPVLAIDFLEVKQEGEGIGTKILKFAEEYSKQIGCNGYLILKADGSYMPQKIPHLFYRKFGFSTLDERTDKKLDKFIAINKNATIKDFPCLLMHYPPQPQESSSFLQKVCNLIKKLH